MSLKTIVLAALTLPATVALAQHAGDVFVGRTLAGQLKIGSFNPDEDLIGLTQVSKLFEGWADNNPGFDRLVESRPAEDFYVLGAGARVWLELLAADPAFRAIDNSLEAIENPGDRTYLGDQTLHTHVTWHINSAHADFELTRCEWHATLVLRDFGGTGYLASVPFTLRFRLLIPGVPDGDYDDDGQVASADYAVLAECLDVPMLPGDPEAPCVSVCTSEFDLDGDQDVDLRDVAAFQNDFGQ